MTKRICHVVSNTVLTKQLTQLAWTIFAAALGDTHSLGSSQGHSCNAWDVLQAKLANSLSCLLLVSAVDSDLRACRDVGIALLGTLIGVRRVGSILGDGLLGLLVVVRKLLNARVRHGCSRVVEERVQAAAERLVDSQAGLETECNACEVAVTVRSGPSKGMAVVAYRTDSNWQLFAERAW